MNKFLSKFLVAALMLWGAPAFAAWTFVNQVTAVGISCNETSFSSGQVDMTGADTFFMVISEQNGVADPTVSDSVNGATYTKLLRVTNASGPDVAIWRVSSATAGAAMTFTSSNNPSGNCISFVALGFSGGHASPDDLTRNNSSASTTSLQTGSSALTPSENNTLVIAGLAGLPASPETATIDESYSTVYLVNGAASVTYGVAAAYKIQTTSTSTNPTFSWTTANAATTLLADFKSAAGGGGGAPRSRNCALLGVC